MFKRIRLLVITSWANSEGSRDEHHGSEERSGVPCRTQPAGGLRGGQKNLTAATKEAYQDVLLAINRLEPKLFFQLLEN